MPNYKLIYYNGRGRAELSRFLFAQAGVAYEDNRVTGEELQVLKPSLPTGLVPVLEVDGKMLAGSGPIALYLAEEFGLAGSNNFQKAEICNLLDITNDLFAKVVPSVFGDPESKEKAKKDLELSHIPKYVGILERLIGDNDWAYGQSVTIADFGITIVGDTIFGMFPDQADKFPKVKKCMDAVKTLPKIAEWIKTRPKTQY